MKHILVDEESEIDFTIYGIKTHSIPEYLFIFHLNRSFEAQFTRVEDLWIRRNNTPFSFSKYLFHFNQEQIIYEIFTHKSHPQITKNQTNSLFSEEVEITYLLPKKQFYNYILKTNFPLTKEILLHLHAQSEVIQVQQLSPQDHKELNVLIA